MDDHSDNPSGKITLHPFLQFPQTFYLVAIELILLLQGLIFLFYLAGLVGEVVEGLVHDLHFLDQICVVLAELAHLFH